MRLFRRAVDLGLPDDLLFKTLFEIGRLEKKLERYEAALAVYTDLAAAKNPYRILALEELAKYYERRERNYSMALEMTRSALEIEKQIKAQVVSIEADCALQICDFEVHVSDPAGET